MKITVGPFSGEIPRTEPRYLPEVNAAASLSARLNRGNLEPMRDGAVVNTFASNTASFFLYGASFLPFAADSDCVIGPIAQNRLYVSSAVDVPKLLNSGTYYSLALAAPTAKPTLALGGTLDPSLQETILYAYTWVTSLGEESQPSPVSSPLTWSAPCTVTVTTPTAPPAGRLITRKRLYRSVTSASGATELYFVADVAVGTANYVHNIATTPTGEAITSTDFTPPISNLAGFTALPNGIVAGFERDGRSVYFCEPYIPHAWPDKYALKVNDQIVGLAAFGTSLAVMTTGTPYVIQGLHPDSMAMQRVEVAFPCVAKQSIVDMGYAAIYASTDGLVEITQSGARLVSESIWTKEQWQALSPATIRAGFLAGRYVMSYQPGGTGPRLLSFVDLAGGFVAPVADSEFVDFQSHIESGRLLGLKSNLRDVVSLDDPTAASKIYSWKSKPFRTPSPVSMGCAIIDAVAPISGTPSFTAKVYAGGVLLNTFATPNVIVRLPVALSELWQVEILGNYTVTRGVLAGSPDEVWA
jgi:hypothetical protein